MSSRELARSVSLTQFPTHWKRVEEEGGRDTALVTLSHGSACVRDCV